MFGSLSIPLNKFVCSVGGKVKNIVCVRRLGTNALPEIKIAVLQLSKGKVTVRSKRISLVLGELLALIFGSFAGWCHLDQRGLDIAYF